MDGIYANTGAAPIGQARPATPDEMYKLKQSQAANQCAPARPEIPESLEFIAQIVLQNATDLYYASCHSVTAICNPVDVDQPNRQTDGAKGDLILASRYIDAIRNNFSQIRRVVGVLLVCLVLGSGMAFAQKPAAPAPVADDNIACSTKVQPTTGFTECEMLRLSNYMSQLQAIKAESDKQVKPVADAGNEFIGKVVARNPGKQYESASQQFPLGRLVPIPAPVAPTDPHTGQPAVAPTAAPTPAPAPATPPAKK